MVAWKRFPIPEFDHEQFQDMAYEAPPPLSADEEQALIEKCRGGDTSVCGGYVVMPDEALFERLAIKGDYRHAVMCLLPDKPVHLLGRSHAWPIERATILNSRDPQSAEVLHQWKTPRPMNTRLGPENGVEIAGGVYYVLTGHKYADHWISNQSIIENDWEPGEGKAGFRVLASSDDELNDFNNCYLAFTWAV